MGAPARIDGWWNTSQTVSRSTAMQGRVMPNSPLFISPTFPKLEGNIEVTCWKHERIVIAADPQGLKSLAAQLLFLADIDQESLPDMPDGERMHTHFFPGYQFSGDSMETEICRLDAKGTGEFPEGYKPA